MMIIIVIIIILIYTHFYLDDLVWDVQNVPVSGTSFILHVIPRGFIQPLKVNRPNDRWHIAYFSSFYL